MHITAGSILFRALGPAIQAYQTRLLVRLVAVTGEAAVAELED
jgi:hypothetical protein